MALITKTYHKTRQHLIDVMNEMLRHATIEDITIKALVQRADITRSTFYTYYQDKYALFEDLIEQCNQDIYFALRYVPADLPAIEVRTHIYDNVWQVLTAIHNNKHIFSQLHPELRGRVLDKEIRSFKPIILQQIRYLKPHAAIDQDMISTFYLSGMISIYDLWVSKNFHIPIEELCETMTDLTMIIYTDYLFKE